jgi:hypothetical protein
MVIGPNVYRNGHRTERLKTAEGPVEYSGPQIANGAVPLDDPPRRSSIGAEREMEALRWRCIGA